MCVFTNSGGLNRCGSITYKALGKKNEIVSRTRKYDEPNMIRPSSEDSWLCLNLEICKVQKAVPSLVESWSWTPRGGSPRFEISRA